RGIELAQPQPRPATRTALVLPREGLHEVAGRATQHRLPSCRARLPADGPPDGARIERRAREHGEKRGRNEARAPELDGDARLIDIDQAVVPDATGQKVHVDHGPGIEPHGPAECGTEPGGTPVE